MHQHAQRPITDGRLGLATGPNLWNGQTGTHEPRFHQPVEPLHQAGRGAEVVLQHIDSVHPAAGREIGGQIPSTEAIDRLLGIPHKQEQMVTALRKATRASATGRVRVLELVPERSDTASQRRRPRRLVVTRVHGRQQTGEGDSTTAAAAARQFLSPQRRAYRQIRSSGPSNTRMARCSSAYQAGFGFTAAWRPRTRAGME